jgi:hypothetical protein
MEDADKKQADGSRPTSIQEEGGGDQDTEQFTVLDSGRVNCLCTVVERKEEDKPLAATLDQSTLLEGPHDGWDLIDTDLQNEWVQIDTAKTRIVTVTNEDAG